MKTWNINGIVIGEGKPKIIIPIIGETNEEVLKQFNTVMNLEPDIIEWRADAYEKVEHLDSVINLLCQMRKEQKQIPLLFTFRTKKEGGLKDLPTRYYKKLLETVIETKLVDVIDIELFTGDTLVSELISLAVKNSIYTIISYHDFHETPSKDEIVSRLKKMQDLGGHIPKIAVMPHNTRDLLTLLAATETMKTTYADRPLITIAMGPLGLISRIGCEVFGSSCTFGAGEQASAPGQIPAQELQTVLQIIHKNL